MKTRTALGGFLIVLTLAWACDVFVLQAAPAGAWPWVLQRQALYLTGIWSIALMALIMLLALRPAWLERPLGGMDRVYRLHKWAGILAVGAGAAHWLIKLASGPMKSLLGTQGRPARDLTLALFEGSRGIAKDLGEWSIYALLLMLALTLWRRFPYHAWRLIHRVMPALFLVLAFHAVALAPAGYWTGITGLLLVPLLAAGAWSAGVALAGRIGHGRRSHGRITALERKRDGVLEVECRLDAGWRGHQAGQFAFVRFDRREGAHPYTIASAPRPDGAIRFEIKALGDYTSRLPGALRVGQPVEVEGPYGCFQLDADAGAPQVWVAGGIGVTPFLAWLDTLAADPSRAQRATALLRARRGRRSLRRHAAGSCAALPSIQLNIHDAARGQRLDATQLTLDSAPDMPPRSGSAVPPDWRAACATACDGWAGPTCAGTRKRSRCVSIEDGPARQGGRCAARRAGGLLRFPQDFRQRDRLCLRWVKPVPSSTPDPLAIGTTIDPSRQARGPTPSRRSAAGGQQPYPKIWRHVYGVQETLRRGDPGGGFDPGAGGRMLGRHRGQ